MRDRPMPHLLLSGGAGLGKTSLARAVATELGRRPAMTSGPAVQNPFILIGLLTRIESGGLIFLDEIHDLPQKVAEMFYEALEDRTLSLPVAFGVATRTLTLKLEPFTLLGATTEPDRVIAPLRARFGFQEELEPYETEDLVAMAVRAAEKEHLALDPAAALVLAGAAHGTPRELLRLFARVGDAAMARTRQTIDPDFAREVLHDLGIDERGLGPVHRRILEALQCAGRRALSLSRLAAIVQVSVRALKDVYEPPLLRLGLVAVTTRGRALAT